MSEPEPFELVPLPEPLRLAVPGRVVLRDNVFALVDAIAEDVFEAALDASAARGVFHFGLSLTPVVEMVLRRMLIDHSMRALPWDRTHVWLTDDAPAVSGEAPTEGFREFLADHAGVPAEQVHMPLKHLRAEAATEYAERLDRLLRRSGVEEGFDFAAVTVGGEGIVGVSPPAEQCAGHAHAVRGGEWTAVHPRVFGASGRVAIVAPDLDAFGYVKGVGRGRGREGAHGIAQGTGAGEPGWSHVRPASPDRLTWYVSIESGETDGRPEKDRRR